MRTTKPIVSCYAIFQTILVLSAITLGMVEQYRFGQDYVDSIMPYIGLLFDLSGYVAICCVITHIVIQYYFTWKLRCVTTVTLIILYVSSYALLSWQGNYHASRSGMNRWNSIGLAVVDQDLWHPKGVFWQPFVTIESHHTYQATLLGWFYSPLIHFDRKFVHQTVSYFQDQATSDSST